MSIQRRDGCLYVTRHTSSHTLFIQAVVAGFKRDVSADITGLLEADWAGFVAEQKTVSLHRSLLT